MPDATPVAKRVTHAANSRKPTVTPREVQDRLTEATRSKDFQAIISLYHPDARIVSPDGVFTGHQEIEQFLRSQLEPFSDLEITIERKLDDGDTAVDEGAFAGVHSGPFRLATGETIAPTGRRVSQRSADAATVRDGKVVSHRFYYDNLDLAAQLGLTG